MSAIDFPVLSAAARRPLLSVVAALMLGFVLYIPYLGKSPLRINAEIRCYRVVSAMVKSGDYMIPRLMGHVRVHKPPLFYWLASVATKVRGAFDLIALRSPAVVAALGILGLAWLWGRRFGFPTEAFLSVVFLGTTYLFIVHSRRGSFEMTFAFFTNAACLAAFSLFDGFKARRAWLAAVLFGLGFLTKATPIFLYFAASFVVLLAFRKQLHCLKQPKTWMFAAAALLLGTSWYWYVVLVNSDARETVVNEFLLPFGFKDPDYSSASHFQPFYYYVIKIWRFAFPLSLLLPVAGYQCLKTRMFANEPVFRALFIMFAVPFILFSLLPQKQDHYMLPALLPLALVCARSFVLTMQSAEKPARVLLIATIGAFIPAALVFTTVGVIALILVLDSTAFKVAAYGIVGIVLIAGIIAGMRMRRPDLAIFAGLTVVVIGWACYFRHLRPLEDAFGSGRIYDATAYPDFRRSDWEKKFAKYPYLELLLDVDSGIRRAKKEGLLPSEGLDTSDIE